MSNDTVSAHPNQKRRILILGAGFGGLTAARLLGQAFQREVKLQETYEIIVIDRNTVQVYTPGLYEVATTLREDAGPLALKRVAGIPVAESLAGLPVAFLQDHVTHVDKNALTVTLRDSGTLHADHLILALGSVTHTFAIPGVEQFGLPLKTFTDALHIRSKLNTLLKEKSTVRIIIGGGGATGSEFAAELATLAENVRERFKKDVSLSISVVEATDRLLPGLPERVAALAVKRLDRLGINCLLNTRITEANETHVVADHKTESTKHIPFDLFVWTGGIKPNPLLADIILPKNKKGLCLVDPDLTVHGNRQIFAVGDLSCFINPRTEKPLPATAYIAIEEGRIAARNVLAHIKKERFHHYHPPKHLPFIVPLGGKWAIADIYGIIVKGPLAFLARIFADINYFRKVLPLKKALRLTFKAFQVFFKND